MIPINRPIYGKEEKDMVNKVLDSGMLTVSAYSINGGKYVSEFENKLAKYTNKKFAIAVGSGTAALETSLRALKIGKGHNVVIPSMTFVATANAVRSVGANVIFADVTPDGLLDVDELRKIKKIDCIIPVNLFGRIPKMDYYDYADVIIEDSCQSLGSKGMGYGDVSCISFYASKIITTMGMGGAILTDDYKIAYQLKLARNQGIQNKVSISLGTNQLMGEANAAFGIAQLDKIDTFINQRRKNMKCLGINDDTNGYLGTVTRRLRDDMLKRLHSEGIGATVYYDRPIHTHSFYHTGQELTVTEYLTDSLLSVPVHPLVDKETLETINKVIN